MSIRAAAAALLVVSIAGCGGGVESQEPLPAFTPASVDANAGTWRMIVLTGPAQFNVPPPAPVTDASYAAELTSIRAAQSQLTIPQLESIAAWSGGAVLRWNQILRELVARADLPPAPNGDGSIPVPDPTNPFAEPNFPFANPPYAARAYSYVALAQYEALKVAWYYKYLYKRPAPAKVDSGIRALAPVTDLPAYPSEDAVLSGVTTELLKLLFPTAVEEITLKAGEQRQAALLSGKATPSDIAAGLALGQAVAQVFAARAANDGMRGAAGSAPQWQALEDAAIARGEVPWKSLETPSRPPMLSFFGKVQTWLMTAADLAAERPGPPPSTSSAQMAAELAEVRAARALALLNMAMHDAAVGCWDTNSRTSIHARRSSIRASGPSSACRISHPTSPVTRPSRRQPQRFCHTSFRMRVRTSPRNATKRRCRDCTAGFTIAPTSRSANSTASVSRRTHCASRSTMAPTE